VFVLKDSNDWPGHSLSEAMVPPIRMMIMVARWACGLLNDFPPFESADQSENRDSALRQVAAMNLKKAAGGPAADSNAIAAFARQDAAFLHRQLADLAPEILVACGTWDALLALLSDPPKSTGKKCVIRDPRYGALVVPMRHPTMASARKTYATLHALMTDAAARGV
jgi:hypothetical protein